MVRTVFPSKKKARRMLRKLNELRRREERLGYNLSSGYSTGPTYIVSPEGFSQ